MWTAALAALFVLLSGILAGVLFSVEAAVIPAIRSLTGERYIEIHRKLDRRFDPLMPRVNKMSLLVCGTLVIFAGGYAARLTFAASGLCIIGVAVVSEVFNVRMNRHIDTWDPSCLPEAWTSVRAKWATANRVRTILAIAGFIAAVAGDSLR